MTTTVFVIEDGDYSGYRVVGVFTTRKNAETVRAVVGGEIAEWALDPACNEINAGMRQWHVLMLRDGSVERSGPIEVASDRLAGESHLWRRTQAPAYRGKGVPDCLDATVWAVDEKHAIKIVNEQRAQLIAGGKWP